MGTFLPALLQWQMQIWGQQQTPSDPGRDILVLYRAGKCREETRQLPFLFKSQQATEKGNSLTNSCTFEEPIFLCPPYQDTAYGKTANCIPAWLLFEQFIQAIFGQWILKPLLKAPSSASHACPAGKARAWWVETRPYLTPSFPSSDLCKTPPTFKPAIIRCLL